MGSTEGSDSFYPDSCLQHERTTRVAFSQARHRAGRGGTHRLPRAPQSAPPQRHAHPRRGRHSRTTDATFRPSLNSLAHEITINAQSTRNHLQQILPRLSERESSRSESSRSETAACPPLSDQLSGLRKGQIDQSRPRLVRHSGSAACNRSLGTAAQPRVTVM